MTIVTKRLEASVVKNDIRKCKAIGIEYLKQKPVADGMVLVTYRIPSHLHFGQIKAT